MTAPLPQEVWAQIGWERRELLGDMAHAYIYAQRTADDRIALGGRGVPYRFGSKTDTLGQTQPETIAQLTALLHELFPATAAAPVEHAWCGVLGVPRDWSATVRLDRATGVGTAGGYVGNGVTTSALMGRTLADLALGRDTRADRAPLGRPRGAPLGARAAALDRRQPRLRPLPRRRPPRVRLRQPPHERAGEGGREAGGDVRRLTIRELRAARRVLSQEQLAMRVGAASQLRRRDGPAIDCKRAYRSLRAHHPRSPSSERVDVVLGRATRPSAHCVVDVRKDVENSLI